MSTVRKMKKREAPSLASAVLDIDGELTPGTPEQAVEISGAAWAQLVELAASSTVTPMEAHELERLRAFREELRELVALRRDASNAEIATALTTAVLGFMEGQREAMLRAGGPGPGPLEDYKRRLAVALGEPPDNPDAVDLIVLAQSTRMTAERWEEQIRKKFDAGGRCGAVVRAPGSTNAPASCGLPRGHVGEHDTSRTLIAPEPFEAVPPPLKPKRERKRRISCDHCGEHGHDSEACGLKPEPEPQQVELEDAIGARRPPGRPTRKFPQGGARLTEKCTDCGRELGEHDGSECPIVAPVPEVSA